MVYNISFYFIIVSYDSVSKDLHFGILGSRQRVLPGPVKLVTTFTQGFLPGASFILSLSSNSCKALFSMLLKWPLDTVCKDC